ncbi:hypothetical protein G6O69_18435 [Pseudenhygromyxa sp. WMMC2535]|uniref:hypothetical protein n=1 Tax=Pseudenhygromyxa sp. WMMC2535 TaxID=2712867 RepID=UPI0015517663|nr:hypothetical protein [Pseudenhygromyxa sp. WMMC2535]NVB39827.1 hypothetical protein [Pseudenhygromyxa sp. WMMC2535]
MTSVAIVGPSGAGKTVYLACLIRAGFSPRIRRRPVKIRSAGAANDARLRQLALEILQGQTPEATAALEQFELSVHLPGSRLFGIGEESINLRLIDGPGGHSMPGPEQSLSTTSIEALAQANCLMIMIPAALLRRPENDLPERLERLSAQLHRGESGAPPFLRVAVVMTMAELLDFEHGDEAFAMLDARNPRETFAELLGHGFLTTVRSLVPSGGDYYALVSAFGFEQSGEVAAILDGPRGWRLRLDTDEFRNAWYPYRVFEPIEFLGRGIAWREHIH